MQHSNKLKIENIPIHELIASEYNPRTWDQQAVDNLTESIKKYGLVDPLIVNGAKGRKNIVIGGHFRLKIAKDLGYTEVPVVYIDLPEIEREKELNLRLNKNVGAWDYELLKDFDIGVLMDVGFDDADLSAIWDEQLGVGDDEFNTEDELAKIKEPKTKIGHMYRLGRHRLLCGDATNHTDVDRLLGGKKVDLVYCDPIYNIELDYNKGIGSKKQYGGQTRDNKSDSEYAEFLTKSLQNLLKHIKKNCHFFYWCDQKYIGLLQSIYTQLGIVNKRVCLWIKNNANMTPQVAFSKVYEPCVYGTVGNPYLSPTATKFTEVLNKEIDTGNRTIDDIIDLLDIWLVKRLPGQEYEHPTEKPATLHEKPLRRCTKPGDVVVDLFGGSGSTLIACEQMNRTCFMMEIEPVFCDLIIKRYEKLTGKEAVLCE